MLALVAYGIINVIHTDVAGGILPRTFHAAQRLDNIPTSWYVLYLEGVSTTRTERNSPMSTTASSLVTRDQSLFARSADPVSTQARGFSWAVTPSAASAP